MVKVKDDGWFRSDNDNSMMTMMMEGDKMGMDRKARKGNGIPAASLSIVLDQERRPSRIPITSFGSSLTLLRRAIMAIHDDMLF